MELDISSWRIPPAVADEALHLLTVEGLASFDLNNPKQPRLRGHYLPFHGAEQLAMVGDRLFALDARSRRLWALDWSGPGQLAVQGSVELPIGAAQLVAAPDGLLVAGNQYGGAGDPREHHDGGIVQVFEAAPSLRERGRILLAEPVEALAAREGLLVTADSRGLSMLRIEPGGSRLEKIARLPQIPDCCYQVAQLVLQSDHAWLAGRSSNQSDLGSLKVVDLREPSRPRWLADLRLPRDRAESLTLGAQHAFLGTNRGLYTIDIRAPASPRLVGYLELPGPAESLVLCGDELLVTGYRNSWLFDVTQPARPRTLARLSDLYRMPVRAGARIHATSWHRWLYLLDASLSPSGGLSANRVNTQCEAGP